ASQGPHRDVLGGVDPFLEKDHGHLGSRLPAVLFHPGRGPGGAGPVPGGEGRGLALEKVREARHQNIMKRVAPGTRAAISAGDAGMRGCPSVFHPGPEGTAVASTWKGMPSFLRAARNLAMSSPSTRSSVSSSRRWTAGPVSTMRTGFSPATTPKAMRMASLARWETRGSSEMTTRTGWRSAMPSVQREEAIGAVDHVGEHDQATVGGEIGQGKPALLAAVGAHEETRAPLAQRLDTPVLDGGHPIVDQVEI